MPAALIQSDPMKRYRARKVLLSTSIRAKLLVERKDRRTRHQYIMLAAPTTNLKGEPNTVRETILKLLDVSHPHIINLIEAYEHNGCIYWIMEDYLNQREKPRIGFRTFTEVQIAELVRDLCSAMLYLHKRDVVHGSMSVEELDFFLGSDDKINFLISDLGISRHVDKTEYRKVMSKLGRKGTPPESKGGQFTTAGDVWSIGAVAYTLLTSDISPTPFVERPGFDLEKALEGREEPISKAAKDFVCSCLREKIEERMKSTDLLKHHWMMRVQHPEPNPKVLNEVARNLRAIPSQTRFRRMACRILVDHALHKDFDDYRILFKSMDTTCSGVITPDEFFATFRGKVPEVELVSLFLYADENSTGVIEFDSFLALVMAFRDNIHVSKIIEAFHSLDMDDDGCISPTDLATKFNRKEEWCEKALAEATPDVDFDHPKMGLFGFLSLFRDLNFAEWLSLHMKLEQQKKKNRRRQ